MNTTNQTSPIIRGCWQLASDHSKNANDIAPIIDAINSGFNTFDCADIYLGVEELLGKALKHCPGKKLRIHTKFVPDLASLPTLNRRYVEKIIDRSLLRLGVEQLDLLQFHWWDWEVKNYLPIMDVLNDLKVAGKIAEIGLTNVNKHYLEEFSAQYDIYSLQAQVSLFDKRLERGVSDLCRQKGIKIFAYGSLLGGFLSEKWLNQPEPKLDKLQNRSLVKYNLLIDSACGWTDFQRRLAFLNALAKKYECDIANIVIAALAQAKKADAIIVGLSPTNYATQNLNLAQLPLLDTQDCQTLNDWSCHLTGDPYDAERDKDDVHAKVMKYNLNG